MEVWNFESIQERTSKILPIFPPEPEAKDSISKQKKPKSGPLKAGERVAFSKVKSIGSLENVTITVSDRENLSSLDCSHFLLLGLEVFFR